MNDLLVEPNVEMFFALFKDLMLDFRGKQLSFDDIMVIREIYQATNRSYKTILADSKAHKKNTMM